ncbi:hypothetical protein C9994_16175, partial [Marivirga lumbricoides]
NVMATYKEQEEQISGGTDKVLRLSEQFVYGSDRLGLRKGNGLKLRTIRQLDGLPAYELGSDEGYTAGGVLQAIGLQGDSKTLAQLAYDPDTRATTITPQPALGEVDKYGLMTSVANAEGELQFSLQVAHQLNGAENVAMVTDADGNLMEDSHQLDIVAKGQAVGFRRPGSATEYMLIAPNNTGGLYYHTVEMRYQGNSDSYEDPKGELFNLNNQLLEGNYLPAIAVVTDYSQSADDKVYMYVLEQQQNASQVRLVGYQFGADVNPVKIYEGPVQ